MANRRSAKQVKVQTRIKQNRRRRQGLRQLVIESLEDRRLLAVQVTPLLTGQWVSEGAEGITNGQVLNIDTASNRPNPTTGAIRAIAVQADKPGTVADESKIAYVGSVNGGVWRTADIFAASVDWEPQTDLMPSSAIGAIAISPLDGDVVYAGTGKFSNFASLAAKPVGLYRTLNGNSGSPHWDHLTDTRLVGDPHPTNIFEGLAITSLALSPTNSNVILVGAAGNRPGLYRSEDAGATWTYLSGSINAPDGLDNNGDGNIDEPLEVNAIDGVNNDSDDQTDEADEFNFPPGTVTDIAFVPGTDIVYAGAITARKFGGAFGIPVFEEALSADFFVSEDGGITWTSLQVDLFPFQGNVTNAKLAIHHSQSNGTTVTVVYLGIVKDLGNTGSGTLVSLKRLDNDAGFLLDMDLPPKSIHPGAQGVKNFSLVADPLDSTRVYIGGDRVGDRADYSCNASVGNLLRGTYVPVTDISPTWEPIVCSGANNTAPHADSRDMKFIPGHPGLLLEADDGGIYMLDSSSGDGSKQWKSKIGDLQLGEVVSVGYNSTDDLFLAGLQDNSVTQQTSSTSNLWTNIPSGIRADGTKSIFGGDGYLTLVDPTNPRAATIFVNNLKSLHQVEFNADGSVKDLTPADGTVSTARKISLTNLSTSDSTFSGADTIQVAYHNTDPSRMFLGYNDFYEISAGKAANTKVASTLEAQDTAHFRGGVVTAMAVGTAAEPDVAYVARSSSIAVRRPGDSFFSPIIPKNTAVCGNVSFTKDVVGFPLLGLPISGIKINPDNWQQAFAVEQGGVVYETQDGGDCWSEIRLPSGVNGYSLELVNPTAAMGDEILVVGTSQGVFRSERTAGQISNFVSLGLGLPNTIVMDTHFDRTDDLIYVGTLGRGVWKLTGATAALSGNYEVTGTSSGETIEFRVGNLNSAPVVEILADGVLVGQISVESYGTIRVNAGGGSDTIVVNNSAGFLGNATFGRHSLTFEITGGENGTTDQDVVRVLDSALPMDGIFSLDAQLLAAESGIVNLQIPKNLNGVTIRYSQIEQPLDLQIPSYSLNAIGAGILDFAEQLSFANSSNNGGIAPGLLQTISGQPATLPNEAVRRFAPDAFPEHIADAAFQSAPLDRLAFLRRLIETGQNAFRLEDVGVTLTTAAALESALENLDDIPNNVSVTETTTAQGPVTRFDVGIERTLFGSALLDVLAQSRIVSLTGAAELYADLKVRLVFGIDHRGFFIDPNPVDANGNALGPEVVISHVHGTLHGKAILGPIEAQVNNGQLIMDEDVRLQLDLMLPTAAPPADGLLRPLTWLSHPINELLSVELISDPLDATPDISISADFSVSLFKFENLAATKLTLEWQDAADLSGGSVRLTDSTSSSGILNFLNTKLDDVLTGIQSLAGAIEQSTDLEVLNRKLPLIDQTLGQLLSSPPEPLVFAASEIMGLVSRSLSTAERSASVSIVGNLLARGIEVGNLVEYQTASGAIMSRPITQISADTFQFEFSSDPSQQPGPNSTFKILRTGGMAARIRSLIGGIDFKIPTLQQMVLELEQVTGLNLHDHVKLVGTPGGSDFAIQFPLTFDPDPLHFVRQISFKDKLPKLDFEADAQLELIVDPRFEITVGVSLAKHQPDGSPLSVVERVYVVATKDDVSPPADSAQPTGIPLAQLDVTARLNDPALRGRFGFLNVALMEDLPANAPVDDPNTPIDEDGNQGVTFTLHTALDFQDPDTGMADQRIRLVELASNIANIAKFGVQGALDIDGLKIVASVGDGFELGNVKLSLDGSTNGVISSFDDFARILTNPQTGIRIVGDLTVLDSFTNITSEQVFAALDLLIDKLRDLGFGSALDKPIPLINRSVSDLVDLGESFSKTVGKPSSPNAVANALAMEAYINSKLGNSAHPDVVDVTVTTSGIEFTFKFNDHVTKVLPLAFSAGQSGLSISGDANLNLNACVAMSLTLGLSNKAGLAVAERLYINTVNPADASNPPELLIQLLANTGYNVSNDCGGTTINAQGAADFSATVGPLGLQIEDARALIDLTIGVDLTTTNTDKHVSVGTLLTATTLQPTFLGSIQAIVPIDGNNDGQVATTGQLNPADARIEVAGRISGLGNTTFSFAADPASGNDLPHHVSPEIPLSSTELATLPAGTIKIVSHNLEGLVSSSFLNFGTLIEGLEQLIKWAEKIFDRDLLNRKIPFLGKSVGDSLDFLENDQAGSKSLRSLILGIIAKRIGADGSDSLGRNLSTVAVQKAIDAISDALFLVGAVPLTDRNANGVLDARDLAVVETNATGISGVTYRLKFQPSFSYQVPFDLGVDFLDLKADGKINVSGQLDLNLNFGINKDEGFFLLLDPSRPEFGVSAAVSAVLNTSAKFGFLDVLASLQPGTNMTASFTVDVATPNPQNKVRFADLIQANSISTLIPNENLKLEIEAHLIANLATAINPELPSLSAQLRLDWGIPDTSQVDKFRSFNILTQNVTPAIALTNIQLDMGSFFSSVVKSIFQRISDSNLVPEKLLHALSQPIPLIDRTVLELLQEIVAKDANPDRRAAFELLFGVASLITEANSLSNTASDRGLIIRFPDITIAENPNSPGQAQPTAGAADSAAKISIDGGPLVAQPADNKDAAGKEIPGSGLPVVGSFLKKLGDMGITFPVLRLSNLMQMLVGNDLDLVFIKAPELDIKKEFNATFPLIGGGIGSIAELSVNAFVGGGFELKARLTGGLDTSGLRHGRFLGGFYFGDFDPGENGQLDPTDEERPELQFAGFVQAGIDGVASIVGFDIGRVTGYFKLEASVGVDLNDDNEIGGVAPPCDTRSYEQRHDGKLHLNEMQTISDSHDGKFLANFELTGEIVAELGVHILVLGGLLLDRTESTRFVLLSFQGTTVPVKCVEVGGGSGGGGTCANPFDLQVDFDLDTGSFQIEIPPEDLKDFQDLDDLLVSTEDLNGNPTDGGEISAYLENEINIIGFDGLFDIFSRGDNVNFTQQGVTVGHGASFNVGGQLIQGVVTSVTAGSIQVAQLNLGKAIAPRSLRGDGEPNLGLTINDGQETLVFEGLGSVQRVGPNQCGVNNIPDAGASVSGISTSDPVRGLGDGDNQFTASGSVRVPLKILGGRGHDRLQGGAGPVEFRGGDGNDVLIAGSGATGHGRTPATAKLFGDNGRDSLRGGPGDDLLVGGDGDDTLQDGPSGGGQTLRFSGNDKVVGGGGKDRLLSAGGFDILVGDYDEMDDRRPSSVQQQREARDIIQGGSGGKSLIFGDNHGVQPTQPGPSPATGRSTGDVIRTLNANDETYAERDDQLSGVVASSIIRLNAESQAVTLSPTLITIGKNRPLTIAVGARVEITGSSGVIQLQGTDAGELFVIKRVGSQFVFVFDGQTTISIVDSVNHITVLSGGGSDIVEVDFSGGLPVPIQGIQIDGQGIGSTGETLRIVGDNLMSATWTNSARVSRSGALQVAGRIISTTNTTVVNLSQFAGLTWNSPGGVDVVALGNETDAGRQTVSSLQIKSNLLPPKLQFIDIGAFVLDTSLLDATTIGDTILLAPSGFVSRGLKNFTVLTGAANDLVSLPADHMALPVAGGSFVIDMGSGLDRLEATGNIDMLLNGDTSTLTNGSNDVIQLHNMAGEQIKLEGGTSNNRFTITNWTGSTTVDGGAGSDLLVLSMRGGTLTAVDLLTLAANVTTSASATSARLVGSFALGATSRTFTIADGTATSDFIIDGTLTGSVGVTKSGAGTMLLNTGGAYTGGTSIVAGTLAVDGNLASQTVSLVGGNLSGNLSMNSTSGTVGILSPGSAAGVMTVQGGLSLSSNNQVHLQLNSTTPGKGYDILDVRGTVNLGGSKLVVTTGFSSLPGNVFTVLTNDGTDAIIGNFVGLAEGALFVAGGFTFRISYRGGTGNDVSLTHVSNVAPAFQNRQLTAVVSEGGEVTLTGTITEPDVGDIFTLEIEWGDGSPLERLVFDPSLGRDVQVKHRYWDDHPTGLTSDLVTVHLLWKDQHGASNSTDLTTQVVNVAPRVTTIFDAKLSTSDVLLGYGSFVDAGTDSWTATVDYGDGSGVQPLPLSMEGKFQLHHRYEQAGIFQVRTAVSDDDGGVGDSVFPVRVVDSGHGLSLVTLYHAANPFDVNDDGIVSPLDALLITNELNLDSSRDLFRNIGQIDLLQRLYYDTSGDFILSPLDVMLVINFLNSTPVSGGEGEGARVGTPGSPADLNYGFPLNLPVHNLPYSNLPVSNSLVNWQHSLEEVRREPGEGSSLRPRPTGQAEIVRPWWLESIEDLDFSSLTDISENDQQPNESCGFHPAAFDQALLELLA